MHKHLPFNVFIGFDSKEPVAFHVATHSLMAAASKPVSVTALIQDQLRSSGVYTRARGATESTEFSLTRFLCPYLSGYQGYSLFVDCDVVFQADVCELLMYPMAFPGKHVYVCQHDYTPKDAQKFLGQQQTVYPRKNWSSFCLFDNAKCTALTPEYVNSASGLDLHRFNWVPDGLIGELPLAWNHLVGEYLPNAAAKVLHFTNGTPCFEAYRNSDHADRWFAMRDRLLGEASR